MKEEDIKKLKVSEVLAMPEFREQMARQIEIEEDAHTKAIRQGRLNRMPIDRLRDRGVFNADTMVQLYTAVVGKSLVGFSADEREYISRIGLVCFGRVLNGLKE